MNHLRYKKELNKSNMLIMTFLTAYLQSTEVFHIFRNFWVKLTTVGFVKVLQMHSSIFNKF